MKGKYLNPKADLTFKKIFGEHPDLVKSLLNALLPLDEGKQIESVEYLPQELVPETPLKKNSIVDVRCHETGGRHFIVEMQMRSNLFASYLKNWNDEFKRRVILNASKAAVERGQTQACLEYAEREQARPKGKAVVKQLNKGEDYTLLQPVYSLNLINDVGFDAGPEEFYHDYAIVNVAHTDRIIEGLRFVFVELPKFFAAKPDAEHLPPPITLRRMAVLWLRFLTEIDEKTEHVSPELLENPDTSHALQVLEKSAYSESQLYVYEQFWDAVVNERVAIEGGYRKGLAAGMAEGLAEGREKGLAEGREKGLAEGMENSKRDTARRMKADGMPTELITKYTGLSVAEIEQL